MVTAPRRALLLATALLALGAAPAAALTWTAPKQLPGRYIDVDMGQAPPLAVNTHGDFVASWIGDGGPTVVAVGNRAHGLSKPANLPALLGDPTVAIAANGRAIIGWTSDESSSLLSHAYYATLSASGKRGPVQRIDAKALNTVDPVFAAQPDGSFLVAYSATDGHGQGRTTLRSLRIGASGRPGTPAIVSKAARFGEDELVGSATSRGELFVCCAQTAGGRTLSWLYAPGKGWSSRSFSPGRHERRGAIATASGLALFLNTDARKGLFGVPVLELLSAGAVQRVALTVAHPTTTAVEAGTIDAHGRPLATFIDGDQVYGVSVSAEGAPGTPVALGPARRSDLAYYGQSVAAPFAAGALVAWTDKDRWHVASEQDGVFSAAPAPPGVVESTRLATAGGTAALSWYDYNHHAFVSVSAP
jgi:hypothetical protein